MMRSDSVGRSGSESLSSASQQSTEQCGTVSDDSGRNAELLIGSVYRSVSVSHSGNARLHSGDRRVLEVGEVPAALTDARTHARRLAASLGNTSRNRTDLREHFAIRIVRCNMQQCNGILA